MRSNWIEKWADFETKEHVIIHISSLSLSDIERKGSSYLYHDFLVGTLLLYSTVNNFSKQFLFIFVLVQDCSTSHSCKTLNLHGYLMLPNPTLASYIFLRTKFPKKYSSTTSSFSRYYLDAMHLFLDLRTLLTPFEWF
jgi:hypothetical protein